MGMGHVKLYQYFNKLLKTINNVSDLSRQAIKKINHGLGPMSHIFDLLIMLVT